MAEKINSRTYRFTRDIFINSYATVTGPKEYAGPIGAHFDYHFPDNLNGEASWEKSEQKLQSYALELALAKGNLEAEDLDFFLGGDLLNQIIATSFTARGLNAPFLGLYGACSTLCEGLFLAAALLDNHIGTHIAVNASSHHDSVERQLRYPTEMGVQRLMSAQWTATAAGSYILSPKPSPWQITAAVPGRVIDWGIADNNDLGSAMAPAACDTIAAFLKDNQDSPLPDLIISGDLGVLGSKICAKLLLNQGYDIEKIYADCGCLLYDPAQDTHSGGSGAGCSAAVLGAYILPKIKAGELNKVLVVATGALLSPTSTQQGETIPSIAHGILIERNSSESR